MHRLPRALSIVLIGGAVAIVAPTAVGRARADSRGITHTALLKTELHDPAGGEVTVWDTEYAPGARNPRHRHPAAITFRVLSGTGIWQEDGKEPVTLRAGDSLLVPAGTIHTHWNPSATEPLRFLEFIVAKKGEGQSVPLP